MALRGFLWLCVPIDGWKGYFPPSLPTKRMYSRESGHKTIEKALGATFRTGPKAFYMALSPDFLESSWWGGFVVRIHANHQSGHKAIKMSRRATYRTGPEDIFYGLVARFSRILLVEEAWWKVSLPIPTNVDTRTLKSPLGPLELAHHHYDILITLKYIFLQAKNITNTKTLYLIVLKLFLQIFLISLLRISLMTSKSFTRRFHRIFVTRWVRKNISAIHSSGCSSFQ